MRNYLFLLAITLFASPTLAQVLNNSVQSYEAGYEQMRIVDETRKRPVHLDVWYPATAAKEKEHNYGFSKGKVAQGASLTAKQLPIVLLSHGAMGAASNYSWLAEYLARRGYLVLGVSHFGESMVFGRDSIDPASVARFGDRTRDLNFALEYLIAKSKYAPNLDAKRIGAIGHSSGGASVLMLGGAEFSAKNLAEYCGKKTSVNDKGCGYPRSAETNEQRIMPEKSTLIFKALIALDPAVGQGFTKNGLKSIKTPTLIIGSVKNDFLPFDSHAGYLAKRIKNSELVKLDNGEGHFVYLDECSLPIKVMEVPLCADGKGIERNAVHLKLAGVIEQFLSRQFSAGK